MDQSTAISWINFTAKLKALSTKIHLAIERPVPHPEYPHLTLLGIWYGKKHICSVTFDQYIPYRDKLDEKGNLTHRGLKTILKYLLTAEFVPKDNSTKNTPKRFAGHYFKPEISIDKVKKVFGVGGEVIHA